MIRIVSALALLLWMGCYLNCSLEQIGTCTDSVFSTTGVDSCPDSEGEDTPDTCENTTFIVLSQEGNLTPEMPIKDLDDHFDILAQLLAVQALDQSSASVEPIFSDPEFSRSEQDYTRVSRPIRGPSV